MVFSSGGRVGVRSCPIVRVGIVSAARVQKSRAVFAAPDYHFTAAPDGGVGIPLTGRIVAGGNPRVGAGVVSPAGIEIGWPISSAPDLISLPLQTAV